MLLDLLFLFVIFSHGFSAIDRDACSLKLVVNNLLVHVLFQSNLLFRESINFQFKDAKNFGYGSGTLVDE
jgi:hypothetical protein